MRKEKIIKAQAKSALSKGCWSTLVGCLAVMLAVFCFVLYAYYSLLYGFNAVDFDSGEILESKELLASGLTVIFIFLLIAASPVINGFSKLCFDTAKYETCSAGDLFFYFKRPGLYIKALGLNILKGAYILLITLVCTLPSGLFFAGAELLNGDFSYILRFFGGIFAITGICAAVVIHIRLVLCNFILAENESIKASACISQAFIISKGHTNDLIRLLISFIFWILLCFFVFPIFYVVPYMGVAFGNSAKWIIALKKEENPQQC